LATTVVEKPNVILQEPTALLVDNHSLPPPKLSIYKQIQRFLI